MNTIRTNPRTMNGYIINHETKLRTKFRLFPIGELPNRFAFIYDEDNDTDGITNWFNFKGFTWINARYFSN